jgi:E3 ubiquitin-protein ligase BRE1
LIDEVKILVSDSDIQAKGSWGYHSTCSLFKNPLTWFTDHPPFRTSLLFDDDDKFKKHLKDRSDDIKETISRLISISPKATAEVSELQSKLAKKLAEEKVSITELEKALSERQQFEEQLEEASLRYMMAEKKLDRARSLTVAKLEKQYLLGAQRPGGDGSSSANREESSPVNGSGPAPEKNTDLEETYNKAMAVSQKQREQLEVLEAENAKLTSQVTSLTVKVSKISSEKSLSQNMPDI